MAEPLLAGGVIDRVEQRPQGLHDAAAFGQHLVVAGDTRGELVAQRADDFAAARGASAAEFMRR